MPRTPSARERVPQTIRRILTNYFMLTRRSLTAVGGDEVSDKPKNQDEASIE